MNSAETPGRGVASHVASYTVVALLAIWLLSPLQNCGFLTDDYHIIRICTVGIDLENRWSFNTVLECLNYFRVQSSPHVHLYRPSVLLTYIANILTTGINPEPFQRTNLALHLVAGALVYGLIRTLVPRARPHHVGLALLFFLVSPVQIEVVSWVAARSETLSLIYGVTALILKLRNRRRVWLPFVFAALALTAKESALAFLPLIIMIDVLRIGSDSKDAPADSARALMLRASAQLALIPIYFLVRYLVFGQFLGAYATKSFKDYSDLASLIRNIGVSLAVILAPVSTLAKESLLDRVPGIALAMTGWAGVATQAILRLPRRHVRRALLVLLLFAVPLAMSVMVNPANFSLVGTRALYTPMAALTVLLVLGMTYSRGLFRYAPIACLLVLALAMTPASQKPHIYVAEQVGSVLQSIWKPIEKMDERNFSRIAILRYREQRFLDGTVTMAAAMEIAVKKPFTFDDYKLLKVMMRGDPSQNVVSFDDLWRESAGDTAVFVMHEETADRPRHCELVYAGSAKPRGGGALALVSPAAGASIVIDLASPSAEPPLFRFELDGVDASAMTLTFMNGESVIPPLTVGLDAIRSAGDGRRGTYDIHIPLAALQQASAEKESFVWFVMLHDAHGTVVARSVPRPLEVTIRAASR